MDSLPEEIFASVAYNLDGDSYLALCCVSRAFSKLLSEKRLLKQVTQANLPGEEVVDAAYYAYCYSQQYLTARQLRNKDSFYEVLKRTLRKGRMTPAAVRALKDRVVSLMTAYLKYIDVSSADVLRRVHRRVLTQVPEVAREIRSFFCSYTKEVLDTTKSPKPLYLQKAKEGDLQWFEEGGEIANASNALFQAVRYGRHEIVRFLDKNFALNDFSLYSFLGVYLDGEMMRLLLNMDEVRRRDIIRRYWVADLIKDDCAEASAVFLSMRSPETDDLRYYMQVAVRCDALGCFRVLTRYLPDAESNLDVRNLLIKNKSYRIWKYYRLDKVTTDDLLATVLRSSVSAY